MSLQLIIDLETLDQCPNSVVLSIGFAAFDFADGKIQDQFNIKLSVEDQVKNYHRSISKDTINWWSKQSADAREILKPSGQDLLLVDAMTTLNSKVLEQDGFNYKTTFIWSRGNNFDFPILDSMYSMVNIKPAYNPWNVRDIRTYIDIMKLHVEAQDKVYDDSDIHANNHNSMEDCICDAKRMIRLFNLFN